MSKKIIEMRRLEPEIDMPVEVYDEVLDVAEKNDLTPEEFFAYSLFVCTKLDHEITDKIKIQVKKLLFNKKHIPKPKIIDTDQHKIPLDKIPIHWDIEKELYDILKAKADIFGIEVDEFIVVALSIIVEAYPKIPREAFTKNIQNLYGKKYGPQEFVEK